MIATFVAGVSLTSVLNYKVTVKAPATIRPAGELRLVQTAIAGTVQHIEVEDNQSVKERQVIAYLDDSRLLTTKRQLQGDMQQGELQLTQLTTQIRVLDNQIIDQSMLSDRTIKAAQESLRSNVRTYQEQQATTQADLEEASAALDLAKEELTRYRQLANTGAIARLQLKEKEAAFKVSSAKLKRAEAALNPTNAAVAIAKQQIAQEQAKGEVALATLKQQRQQLLQSRIELQNRLNRTQKELQQVEDDLSHSVIRAPTDGTILQLHLRNRKQVVQPGEAIAYIAPIKTSLIIKALVASQDIDKVKSGQKVQMQVAACPYPDYGTLKGTVLTVAPDAMPQNNADANTPTRSTFYEVTIQPQTRFVGDQEHQCRLQFGMEGKADIISREETVLKFLLRKAKLITNV